MRAKRTLKRHATKLCIYYTMQLKISLENKEPVQRAVGSLSSPEIKNNVFFSPVRDRSYEARFAERNQLRLSPMVHNAPDASACVACVTTGLACVRSATYGRCWAAEGGAASVRAAQQPHNNTHLSAIHFPFTQSFARLMFGCLDRPDRRC